MRKRIMVVDDDTGVREIVFRQLHNDYDILQASDGREALKLLDNIRPDLVLLDISMPHMGGLEFLKAARGIVPGLLVLMLTANLDLGMAQEALDLGARAYMTKPFSPEELGAEVARLARSLGEDDARKTVHSPWRIVS